MFGVKKDNGVISINTENVFSALESRKKKGGKKKDSNKDIKKATQFWTNAPLTVKSWADCEDDDDYFASAPLPPVWGRDQSKQDEVAEKEGSDEQDDDEMDEEVEEEIGKPEYDEGLLDVGPAEPSVSLVNKTREPEKQLSKKELKKKELAELDRVLAEFGILNSEANGHTRHSSTSRPDALSFSGLNESQDNKLKLEGTEELEGKPSGPALAENKIARKRKPKKEKSKEYVVGTVSGNGQEQAIENQLETAAVVADPKLVLKKLISQQKRKSGKESDTGAKQAAAEAAARAAKQAAAKKKDKMHYNQHPPK